MNDPVLGAKSRATPVIESGTDSAASTIETTSWRFRRENARRIRARPRSATL
jgi:hypothetical protein